MFIELALRVKNEFWRYLVGSLVVFALAIIGQFPLMGIIGYKAVQNNDLAFLNEETIYSYLDSNLFLFLMLISFVFALLGLWLALKYLHHQPLKDIITTRPKVDWRRIMFAFFFWGILSSGLVILDYLYLTPEDYQYNFELNRFLILAVIAIALIPIQTSVEELLFRGYLMQGFGILAKNRWFPLILTSVIFGALHVFNPEVDKLGYSIMIYYIGTGLFLGILTLMDDGMELSLGFHAANNLFTALLVTSDWTAFQTYSILKDVSEPHLDFIDLVLPVFILFPVLLFIFAKVYRWKNWKEKLFGELETGPTEDYKIIE